MKVKIIITDDLGKTYEGEIELKQNIKTSKIILEKKKDAKKFQGSAGGIRLIIENGFLNSPKLVKEIITKLEREGYYGKSESIDKLLRVNFTNKNKILTRIKKDNKFWTYVIRK